MRSRRSLARVLPVVGLSLAGLLSSASTYAQSERTRRTKPVVIAISGKGITKAPTPSRKPFRKPIAPALEWTSVKSEIKSATGKGLNPANGGLQLTVRHPYEENKAFLELGGQVQVDQQESTALFFGEFGGSVTVAFKPTAIGTSTVVDILMFVPFPEVTVTCYLPDGTSKKETLPGYSSTHLAFVVTAATADWQRIRIDTPGGENTYVSFTSATVIPLQ